MVILLDILSLLVLFSRLNDAHIGSSASSEPALANTDAAAVLASALVFELFVLLLVLVLLVVPCSSGK